MASEHPEFERLGHQSMQEIRRETVPEGLTDSILAAVAEAPTARPRWRVYAARAAVIALIAGLPVLGYALGYGAGSRAGTVDAGITPSTRAAQSVYLVILHGPGEGGAPEATAVPVQVRSQRYADWEEGLRTAGKLVTGGELGAPEAGRGVWAQSTGNTVRGWYPGEWALPARAYLVRAWNDDEVESLARRSPHLDLGGSITIQRLQAEDP